MLVLARHGQLQLSDWAGHGACELTAGGQGRRQVGDVALQLLGPALKLLGGSSGGRACGKGQQLGEALEGGLWHKGREVEGGIDEHL